jgi:hypothetical protein
MGDYSSFFNFGNFFDNLESANKSVTDFASGVANAAVQGAGESVTAAIESGTNPYNSAAQVAEIFGLGKKSLGTKPGLFFPLDLFSPMSNNSRVEFDIIGGTNSPALVQTIALYMPPGVIDSSAASWAEESLGGASGAINEMTNAATTTYEAITNPGTSASSTITGSLVNTIDAVTSNQGGFKTRRALNPHKALLYQGHTFRNLSLSFDMYAKSKDESDAIAKIINAFKYAAHPDLAGGTAAEAASTFMYPDQFTIRMLPLSSTREKSKYMFNFGPCILLNMSTNYGPNQAAFFGATGAPVHINLTLEFQETFQLTKQHLRDPSLGL